MRKEIKSKKRKRKKKDGKKKKKQRRKVRKCENEVTGRPAVFLNLVFITTLLKSF